MADDQSQPVRIVDLDMPFWSMVKFILKWVIASIPAMLVLLVLGLLISFVVTGLTTGALSRFMSGDSPAEPAELVADAGGADLSSTTSLSASEWSLSQESEDGSPRVTLGLAAASAEGGVGSEAPALILRCANRETELFIDWHKYLSMESALVSTTLGNAAPVEQRWGVSTDGEASFFPGDAVPFITRMLEAETLVAETTPYGELPVTASFAVKGLADQIEPLRQACGW